MAIIAHALARIKLDPLSFLGGADRVNQCFADVGHVWRDRVLAPGKGKRDTQGRENGTLINPGTLKSCVLCRPPLMNVPFLPLMNVPFLPFPLSTF